MEDPLARKQALLEKQAAARKQKAEEESDDDVVVDETNSEPEAPVVPMRENMIGNAVKFLSHENVKRTPLVRRIAFLEQKGLTNEEITEALRRVGGGAAAPPAAAVVPQQQIIAQPPPVPQRVQYQPPPPPPPRSTFKVVATSVVLTLSAMGGLAWLYNSVLRPQLKETAEKPEENEKKPLTRDLVTSNGEVSETKNSGLERSVSELVQVMKTQQTEVKDTLKMVHTALTTPDKNSMRSSTDQINVKELTSAITELHSLLKKNSGEIPSPISTPSNFTQPKSPKAFEGTPLRSAVPQPSLSTPKSNEAPQASTSAPAAPQSFADVMRMVQAGQQPPNVKQINDSPVDPSAVVSPSNTEKPLKPWEKRRQERTSKAKTAAVEKPSYLANFSRSPSLERTENNEATEVKKTELPELVEFEEIPNEENTAIETNSEADDIPETKEQPKLVEITEEDLQKQVEMDNSTTISEVSDEE